MAKKKTAPRKKTHKGKMGALKAETQTILLMLAGAVTGAVAKRFADNAIAKQSAVTIDPKLLAVGQLVIGGGIAWYVKNPFMKGFGVGMAAEAGVSGLVAMDVLSGSDMQLIETNRTRALIPRPNLAGASITPTIAGANLNAYGFPQGSVGRSSDTAKMHAGVYGY